MPDILYEMSTGVDKTQLLNLKLDTQERLDRLTDLNIPNYQTPFIPKDLSSDSLLQNKDVKLPSLQEALVSGDPRVVKAAQDAIRSKTLQSPASRGIGFRNDVKYQEGQDRFNKDAWYKEDQYSMYGFDPYKSVAENEDWLHHQTWDHYSGIGKTWRGVGTLAGRALSKLVTGLIGTVGNIGAIAWNGLQEVGDLMDINDGTKNNFWNDVSNNVVVRGMEQLDQHVKDEWLPTYKALDYDNKGAWDKVFDPHTWMTSYADGVGFLLQFAVPGTIFGKLGQAGKLARSIGVLEEELATAEAIGDAAKIAKATMTLERAKNVSKLTYAMGYEIPNTTRAGKIGGGIAEFFTGSKDVGGMSAHIFNTSMESLSETTNGFDQSVKDLMDNGHTREDAIKIASNNAPMQFWLNMGILTASNAFENKLLQKAIGNRGFNAGKLGDDLLPKISTPITNVEKFFTGNKWRNKLKFYGDVGVKSIIFEGYWEENAQTAAQRYASGEYERQGNDGGGHEKVTGNFIQQILKQTVDAAKGNDREAADSIMAGAVIGVLGGTTFAKISGERKQGIKDKAEFVANYKNTRDAWMSLDLFSPEIYDKNGKIIPEKAKEKAEQISEKLDKMQSIFKRTVTADTLTNEQEKEKLQRQVFGDFVKAHIMNGTEEDLINRLKNWNNKSVDELSLYGVTQELQKDSGKWASLAEELVDSWDNEIKDIKYNAPKNETVQSYFTKVQAVKSHIFDYISLRSLSKELSISYQNLKDETNPFTKFPLQQPYNEKQAELIVLKQLTKVTITPIIKEQLENKIKELEDKQKVAKDSISANNDTKEDINGFIFPKDFNPSEDFSEDEIKAYHDYMEYQSYQSIHDNSVVSHTRLIKDFSDPQTGLENWNKSVDYWSKDNEKLEEIKKEEVETEVFNTTLDTLNKEKEQLLTDLGNAKTNDDKIDINDKILVLNQKIKKLNEDLSKDSSDVDVDTNIIEDLPDVQYGIDEYFNSLKYFTPFATVNNEAIDAEDDNGNKLSWKEEVIEHGYDHKLTEFINTFAIESEQDPTKYNAFIVQDTPELIKERLSKSQLKDFDESKFEIGAVIIFKNQNGEIHKFSTGETIVFSFNKKYFQSEEFGERVKIKSEKSKMETSDVLEFFKKEQEIADRYRDMVIADGNLQIPVLTSVGSLGIFPTTKEHNALERFKGFHNNNIINVKNVNDFPNPQDIKIGQTVLEIPGKINGKKNTDTGLSAYIPLQIGKLSKAYDTPINSRIKNSIQYINNTKFKTRKEANLIVQSFLKGLFYTEKDKQYFKVVEINKEFKIVYYKVDQKTGKETEEKTFNNLKLKVLDKFYDDSFQSNLRIYEKDSNGNLISIPLSNSEYKEFIHTNLNTNRKVLTVKRGENEYIYTHPVNAYLNLQAIEQEDINNQKASQTTQDALEEQILSNEFQENIDAKADIERRRQEELNKLKQDIPTMITKKLEDDLKAHGLTQQQINKMTSIIANESLINANSDAELVALGKKIEQEQESISQEETKPTEEKTPLEKLKIKAEFTQPIPNVNFTLEVKPGGSKKLYLIDFENNTFKHAGIITKDDSEKLVAHFTKANAYTLNQLNINEKSVYLVQYNNFIKFGKFLIFDENFNVLKETEELRNNEEYKKIKDCK